MELSCEARSLWAKTNPEQKLYKHMLETARKAQMLWRCWVSKGVANECMSGLANAEQLFVFLATAHDVGKATPVFQFNPNVSAALREEVLQTGLPEPKKVFTDAERHSAKHALASCTILQKFGVQESLAIVVGGHHGKPPSKTEMREVSLHSSAFGFNSKPWEGVQAEFFGYALNLSRMSKDEVCAVCLSKPQQMLFMGLLILSDWLASSNEAIELPDRWEPLPHHAYEDVFRSHFHFPANAMQKQSIETALHLQQAGIFIIEAPMGCGKTEAALAVAEIFAIKAKRGGVYFALPSRATADGILERYLRWIEAVSKNEPHALVLAHGKANRNKLYKALRGLEIDSTEFGETTQSVFVHEWLSGKKLQMLADFGVGTVDQLLMGALRHKFLALRHLGLAGKVIIVDEVHAYDAYMDSYLCRMLQWLACYKVPVIILSATLPARIRQKLVAAYVDTINTEASTCGWETCQEYPLVTYSDGNSIHQQVIPQFNHNSMTVQIVRAPECACENMPEGESIACTLENVLVDGGVIGIIVNTVGRAQALAQQLARHFGEEAVFLLHSRFIALDRADLEKKLLEKLGKTGTRPHKLIVVGTQIMEQSLDIDFDLLLTDCCPMDLLLQRIGRLHRHQRSRPPLLQAPQCILMHTQEPEKGAVAVYGAYPLLCTQYLLPPQIVLPNDIAPLVHAAYSDAIPVPESDAATFEQAKEAQNSLIEEKEGKAETFQLGSPHTFAKTLAGWLDVAPNTSEAEGDAAVRDGDASIEVILLQKRGKLLHLLPWVRGGAVLPQDNIPEEDVAYTLSGCSLALPHIFSAKWAQGGTIDALEQCKSREIPTAWEDSHWLRGALYLVLDENFQTELCGKTVGYHQKLGLTEGGDVIGANV